jgi:predicted DNA-binding transcriptional regulator AlpA
MMDKLLTPEDVASILQVPKRQVTDRYAHRPDFPKPVVLPGGRFKRWRREDIAAWIEGLSHT